jgi:uncharacterized membrane protein
MALGRLRDGVIAGFCGTLAHMLLMFAKTEAGILPEFQPYDDLQRALSGLTGAAVPSAIPWLLSFVNGAVIWGFVFGRVYRFLPGRGPLSKGVVFAVCACAAMGLIFFPLVGQGVFAERLNLGAAPAALMLIMLLAYSVTMSLVYNVLERRATKAARSNQPR